MFNQIDANPRAVLTAINELAVGTQEGGGALYLNAPNGALRSILEARDGGGWLTLFGEGNQSKLELRTTSTAGSISVNGLGNGSGVYLEGEAANGGGRLSLRGPFNAETVALAGRAGPTAGGALTMSTVNGTNTVILRAEEANGQGALLQLNNESGRPRVRIDADVSDDGAFLSLYRNTGVDTIHFDSESVEGGGKISVRNGIGNETVEITGAESSENGGGQILLKRSTGIPTLRIDGQEGPGGGGFLRLYKGNGTTAITLDSGDGGGNGRVTAEALDLADGSVLIANGGDAALNGGGLLRLGPLSGRNLVLDGNEILARDDGDTSPLFLNADGGAVAIGTAQAAAGYRLSVNGRVICEELVVQNSSDWPDYVFADDYILRSLEEVEASIKESRHLPGIPTAREVGASGISIGEMQKQMMEKIEELTLYLIEQNKRLKEQESELAALRTRLSTAD